MYRIVFGVIGATVLASLVSTWQAEAQGGISNLGRQLKPDDVSSKDVAAVVNGNNAFAFDLYRELCKKEGNLFFSPYSVSSALAMAYAGARGQTAEEMAKTLHLPNLDGRLHKVFGKLNRDLLSGDAKAGVELRIANAMWGQRGVPLNPDFLRLTTENYGSGLREVDFLGDPALARHSINMWASQNTNRRISDILSPEAINRETRLILTNAIYFNGGWLYPFNKEFTREEDFHRNANESVRVPMMHMTYRGSFADVDGTQIVGLRYKNSPFSFAAALTAPGEGLHELENRLDLAWLVGMLGKMGQREYQITLTIPKVELRDERRVSRVLRNLGMQSCFSPTADLTGISSEQAFALQEVFHKTFLAVDEKGTEAAAVTATIVATPISGGPPPIPPNVTVTLNRPFVLIIYDSRSRQILFLGRVANPN